MLRPKREQLQWAAVDLESLVPLDHPARAIWGFLEKLDLSAFYEPIKAVVDRPGRPTADPEVGPLAAGHCGGDRECAPAGRLCEEHDAYRWVRGHVPINYHMLSDFRVAQPRGPGRPADPDHRFVDGRRSGHWSVWLKTGCGCGRAPVRHPFVASRDWRGVWRRRGYR